MSEAGHEPRVRYSVEPIHLQSRLLTSLKAPHIPFSEGVCVCGRSGPERPLMRGRRVQRNALVLPDRNSIGSNLRTIVARHPFTSVIAVIQSLPLLHI